MNSRNGDTSDPHRLLLNLPVINMLFYQTLEFIIDGKNIKKSCKNNKFKISVLTRNGDFELPVGSYSVSDSQGYFEYILKKHGEKIDNPSIRMYVNKIENIVMFKIRAGYYLERLIIETVKSLKRTKSKIRIKMVKICLT